MRYSTKTFAALMMAITTLFSACQSVRISEHYAHNHYLTIGASTAYNEELPLFMPTYGDIVFERDARMVRRQLRRAGLPAGDSVLAYGYTTAPPHYAVVLTTATDNVKEDSINPLDADRFAFQRDTCIGERRYTLRALAEGPDTTAARGDVANLWERIAFDSLRAESFGSVFAVTEQKTNKLYAILENIEQFPVWTDIDRWNKTQMLLTYASFLGDNDVYRRERAVFRMASDSAVREALASAAPQEGDAALAVIAAEARSRQLVMVNENHFYPNHRVLVHDLLDTFKTLGFQYLALEALAPDQEEAVNRTRTINLQTGFYTQEQQYARLLRKALKLGYQLVAYENTDASVDREEGQARNLYGKTFGRDPQAKVLVLAGMDHILEAPTPSGKKWMAAIFKETYGIDPLTVGQNDLKDLGHLAPQGYLLAEGAAFGGNRLNLVDYQLINNQPIAIQEWPLEHQYRNRSRDTVQVLLFDTERPVTAAMALELPYYTTLVPAKTTVKLPIIPGRPMRLVVYDRFGNRVPSS